MKPRSLMNFVLGLSFGLIIAFSGMSYLSGPGYLLKTGYRDMVREGYGVIALQDLAKLQQYAVSMKGKDESSPNSEETEEPEEDDMEPAREKVRILCWIMTSPKSLQEKAIHVKNTWAKRCDVTLYISSITNVTFPAVGVDVPEGRNHLTRKTMKAFRYVYDRYYDAADWFMKADDDTYVVMENLRHFLSDKNTNAPVYFGQYFFRNKTTDTIYHQYVNGGAGYVLSKEALKRFGRRGWDRKLCHPEGDDGEDVEMGLCMRNLGVKLGDSTDAHGRNLFHCLTPEIHLYGPLPDWYKRFEGHGAKEGEADLGDNTISFHKVTPQMMYTLEYLIYHLKPYGTMVDQDQFSK